MTHEDHERHQIAAAVATINVPQSIEMTIDASIIFEDRITRATPGPPALQHVESLQSV